MQGDSEGGGGGERARGRVRDDERGQQGGGESELEMAQVEESVLKCVIWCKTDVVQA